VSNETIHTALLGIARDGDDAIPLGDGLSLVRPNDQLLVHRWDWAQGKGEMEREAEATPYLVCEFPSWVQGEEWGAAPERGANRFCAGLMAIQLIKPNHRIRTLPGRGQTGEHLGIRNSDTPQSSTARLNLIKTDQGFELQIYNLLAGHAMIEYGHLVHHVPICDAPSEAPFAQGVTEAAATVLLLEDGAADPGLFSALSSFVYNEGAGRLQSSTLLKAGDYAAVPGQLEEWVYGGSVKPLGLLQGGRLRRRCSLI
jgi:GH24 family phage-related lysozyme (muramidase)